MPEPTNETWEERFDQKFDESLPLEERYDEDGNDGYPLLLAVEESTLRIALKKFISEERKRAHSEGYKQGYQDGVDNFVKKVNSYAQSLGLSIRE